ncbi:hypothetical protein LBMAG42_41710 [Deltaproteobacteria bacterium]|nr:hypothetical protein LBMAG42_41710 [Deltaproteobacteria bacterium]
MNALIGWSGVVGSTIVRQAPPFEQVFRSTTIGGIGREEYDLVVCAGAPGAKWQANREPEADRASLTRLTAALGGLRCRRFVLISTVDVFAAPRGVDESSAIAAASSPYGRHRRELEIFANEQFQSVLIVRLPALVGPGLRKNALFDLLNRHEVERLDPDARYQVYPIDRLWADIQLALAADLHLVHLVAPPLRLGDIAREAFGLQLPAHRGSVPPSYDVRSRHAALLGGADSWPVSREESMRAIVTYARSEPRVGA